MRAVHADGRVVRGTRGRRSRSARAGSRAGLETAEAGVDADTVGIVETTPETELVQIVLRAAARDCARVDMEILAAGGEPLFVYGAAPFDVVTGDVTIVCDATWWHAVRGGSLVVELTRVSAGGDRTGRTSYRVARAS
jgi:hypothetical protein